MALTPEQQEHNRREDQLVDERKRLEEQRLREAGLWVGPSRLKSERRQTISGESVASGRMSREVSSSGCSAL